MPGTAPSRVGLISAVPGAVSVGCAQRVDRLAACHPTTRKRAHSVFQHFSQKLADCPLQPTHRPSVRVVVVVVVVGGGHRQRRLVAKPHSEQYLYTASPRYEARRTLAQSGAQRSQSARGGCL